MLRIVRAGISDAERPEVPTSLLNAMALEGNSGCDEKARSAARTAQVESGYSTNRVMEQH